MAPFSVGGNSLATHGDDICITDFNNRSIWCYDIATETFTKVPISNLGPSDVTVDADGMVWFADQVLVEPAEIHSSGIPSPSAIINARVQL